MNILTEKSSKFIIWIGIIIVIIGIISFLIKENIYLFQSSIKSDKVGQFGDFIGGVAGALWALAGVILFYLALDKQKEALANQQRSLGIQHEILKSQKEELALTRKELEETKLIFKEQGETQALLQFESTFFQLLDNFNSLVMSYTIRGGAEINRAIRYKGRECFSEIITKTKNYYHGKNIDYIRQNFPLSFSNGIHLGTYFSVLFQIFRFVEKSNQKNKDLYLEFLFSQLTHDEKFMLFYFANSILCKTFLKEIIEKYGLFWDFDKDTLIQPSHVEEYKASAFEA